MTNEQIQQVIDELKALNAKTAKEVEEARIRFLGKKGSITALFEEFRTIAPEYKKLYGKERAIAKIYEFPLFQWQDIDGSQLKSRDFFKAPVELMKIKRKYK